MVKEEEDITALMLAGLLQMATTQGALPTPSARWEINSATAKCTLRRVVGSTPTLLSIDTVPGSDAYRLTFTAKDLPAALDGRSTPAKLDFGGGTTPVEGWVVGGRVGDGTFRILELQGLKPDILRSLASATLVSMKAGRVAIGPFAINKADKAVAAFNQCNADQLMEWGADPKQFAPGGTLPVSLEHRDAWLSRKVLMTMASQYRGAGLHAVFRIGVSPEGGIDACLPLEGVPNEDIRKTACDVIMSARRFAPARDATGQPVRGAATFRVLLMRTTSRVLGF